MDSHLILNNKMISENPLVFFSLELEDWSMGWVNLVQKLRQPSLQTFFTLFVFVH
ncbi:MAG: hypothetical protein JWQ30_619 [Sediminibacterium sp.]|nr:hypothetical protein [Sediminibacterium sp.]